MSAAITSVLQENRVFPPPRGFVEQANIAGMAQYQALCSKAQADHEGFWADLAKEHLLWHKPFSQTLDQSNKPFYRWFHDGELNVSYNCLDKHLGTATEHKTAIIFEADDGTVTELSYRELHDRVCRFANGLKSLGHGRGERAIIYMPMSIHAVVAMQACARLGITHSVVFGGFSSKSLHERIVDAGATLVIAADEQVRGGKQACRR
jgi:acetyl-CoA synthetase